jgi:hypothetical protein
MRIMSTLAFAAQPDRVATMFISPSFAGHIAKEVKAQNLTMTSIDNGLTAVFTMDSPNVGVAQRILGPYLTLTKTVTWEDSAPDSTRLGRLTITVAGVPATVDGPLRLNEAPHGSSVVYTAELNVAIPLVGKKIEQMVEGYLSQIMAAWERVGNSWLKENPH